MGPGAGGARGEDGQGRGEEGGGFPATALAVAEEGEEGGEEEGEEARVKMGGFGR